MAGYTRRDISNNIDAGKSANAEDLDLEFNGVEEAFSALSGHKHDGSVGEGAPITVIGPAQQYVASANSLSPASNNSRDLGTTGTRWKDLWLAGVATATSFIGNITSALATITGGTINGTSVGATTASTVRGTTITATTGFVGPLTGAVTGDTTGAHNGVVGNVTPAAGTFTTVNASGAITGNLTGNSTGNHNGLVGNVTPAAGTFTTINASGAITGNTTGTHNGAVGNVTPSTGVFTTLSASGASTLTGLVTGPGGFTGPVNGTVGATTPSTGVFTTITSSGTVTGSGFFGQLGTSGSRQPAFVSSINASLPSTFQDSVAVSSGDLSVSSGNLIMASGTVTANTANFSTNITVNSRTAYHRGNIVATVGESGGIPTGGVVQKGSNVNGEFVKFADGTLICWHSLLTSASAGVTWTYPEPFINNSTLSVVASPAATTPRVACTTAITATNIEVSGWDLASARQSFTVRMIATGRWF
jgi:hypothetical protein